MADRDFAFDWTVDADFGVRIFTDRLPGVDVFIVPNATRVFIVPL